MDNKSDNDEINSVEVVQGFGRYKKYRKISSPEVSSSGHLEFIRKRNELNECKSNYLNIRRECYNLDARNDVLIPVKNWYWPTSVTRTTESNDDDDLLQGADVLPFDTERMDIINEYLRRKYRCCYWCGCIYLEESEFIKTCPGDTDRLHKDQDNNIPPVTSTQSD